jgi:predicted nucleic acid-binding Zn ribbon protein
MSIVGAVLVTEQSGSCRIKAPMRDLPDALARSAPHPAVRATPPTVTDMMSNTCSECGRSGFLWWQFTAGVCHGCYTRARRKLKRHKQRDCVTCGTAFTTTRTDAQFCSNACRQKAHRQASGAASP